jgi:hypothetical protein
VTWKPVRVKKVSDLERIAKAERRVVRAAEKWAKQTTEIYSFSACYPVLRAVDALHRARKAKK